MTRLERYLQRYDDKLNRIRDDINKGFELSGLDVIFLHEDSYHNKRKQIEMEKK